jgi:hypothetical protein
MITMSVAKVIELIAQSPKSFEQAIEEGVSRATKTIENVQSVWVKDQEIVVENGKASIYRVALKVTFVLNDGSA